MNLPGLKLRPRRPGSEPPSDDSGKWALYVLAVLTIGWIIYSLFFYK
jgi:hypothetical protein